MNPAESKPECDGQSHAADVVPRSLTGELWNAEAETRGGPLNLGKRLQVPRGGRTGIRVYDFVWLVYSGFFFIQPIQEHRLSVWLWFALFYACFLAIYVGMVFAKTSRVHKSLLAAMAVLGFIYCPFNASACGIFIYVAAFVPFVTESIAVSISTIVLVCVGMCAEAHWTIPHISLWGLGLCAFLAVAVGAGNLAAAQRMRANKRLELAHEEIVHLSRVAERERIARDLHDVLGHTLSVVVLKSELAGKLMDRDPERARREIGEVETIARRALTEVREAIRGYRAEGLAAEIDHAHKTLDAAGVTLECGAKPPQLPAAAETVLSLIVREAVTNIVRHAQASHCRLAIEANGTGTALVVEDDGRGGIRQEGNGLRGMRERVEALGGSFHIESSAGTRLVIELPQQSVAPS